MCWTGFGMRAVAVFLTSVVMFAAMIVISHSLKMTSEVTPFRPAAGRNLSAAEPVEADSDWQWPETADVGPLHDVGAVPSEPVPVVTASPVPDDTAIASVPTDTSPPSTDEHGEPQTTVVATPVPSGERGPAPEREPPQVRGREPAPAPVPTPRPPPWPTPPAPDPDPVPAPPEPEPTPTPTETEGQSASEEADASMAEVTASETPTTTP